MKTASHTGQLTPSQLSPGSRANSTRMPETDIGNDVGADVVHYLLPPAQRKRVILGFEYTASELANSGANDDVQDVDITGTPTGGDFVLTYTTPGGVEQAATAINHDDDAAAVKAALEACAGIDAVTVTGSNPNFVVTFSGAGVDDQLQAILALTTNDLTGGSSPSVTITHTTPGATANENGAHIKLGHHPAGGSLDDDSIDDLLVSATAAVASANHIDPEDMEATLKSDAKNAANPVIPIEAAVVATVANNLVSGDDGKLVGELLWAWDDDHNPLPG